MHIESDTKLDYSDVLLRPKRSTLESRKEVKLTREFRFPHSQRVIDVLPIIAANMDGVGTFDMAKVLAKDNMIVALNKSNTCLLYTSPSPRDRQKSRMPSSA